MATLAARVQAICDAILNRTATQAEQTRLAEAMARNQQRDPATMTQAEKAQLLLDRVREFAVAEVRTAEGEQAARTAQSAAAAAVNTAFTPTP